MPHVPVAFTEKEDAFMVVLVTVAANQAKVPLMVVAKVKTTMVVANAILNLGFFNKVLILTMK